MALPLQQARAVITRTTADIYKERPMVMGFLRSFFKTVEVMSKTVSIEVVRGTEKIASDVQRKSGGNRNSFDHSTAKDFLPPFYHEYFSMDDHRLYDVAIGSDNPAVIVDFARELAEDLGMCQDKIDRAYELNCAKVLQTGIITLSDGTDINFKRKSTSIVDNSGTPWSGANNPYTQILAGCKWLRQNGKAQGSNINMILGGPVLEDFLGNTFVQARGDIKNISRDSIHGPQRNAAGGNLHGVISVGEFNVLIWTYGEYYDAADGTSTPYINDKNMILIPENPRFKLVYAAVPRLLNQPPQRGAYYVYDTVDSKLTSHDMNIKSAGVPIPVAVDQIYTAQVKA